MNNDPRVNSCLHSPLGKLTSASEGLLLSKSNWGLGRRGSRCVLVLLLILTVGHAAVSHFCLIGGVFSRNTQNSVVLNNLAATMTVRSDGELSCASNGTVCFEWPVSVFNSRIGQVLCPLSLMRCYRHSAPLPVSASPASQWWRWGCGRPRAAGPSCGQRGCWLQGWTSGPSAWGSACPCPRVLQRPSWSVLTGRSLSHRT